MKKITVDINVLLDFLNKRKGHENAAIIVDLCVTKQIEGYLCAHEFTTLSYFLLKEYKDIQRVKLVLTELLDIFSTIPVTEKILRDSLFSAIQDFEDAVIEVSSLGENIEYIITGNISDFTPGRVKALSPAEFLQLLHRSA
ncbi:MAG: PIN domain-containing protein [Candidatus Aminicenantes bacterium]|nr:PIN domain-containing protein [Candidatus Aminicenantes bacterium]